MTTRKEDLNELSLALTGAIAKARQLKLPTSVYILSMALLEVSEAMKAATPGAEDDSSG
jgi:hypothetical protein